MAAAASVATTARGASSPAPDPVSQTLQGLKPDAPAPQALAVEQQAARLRNPAEIAQMLSRVHEHRGLITVHVAGSAGSYTSILLSVDLIEGTLLFDELHPAADRRQVGTGTSLNISARLEGSRVEFSCVVRACIRLKGGLAYRASMPNSIDYFERRNSYRLSVPAALQLQPLSFESLDGPLPGRLVDISRRGLAAVLHPDAEAGIGALVPCTLRLLDHPVNLEAEIRSSMRQARGLRLGVMFPRLTPAQHFSLDASVARLERSLLRHYAAARPR